jgi:hypothetical protein
MPHCEFTASDDGEKQMFGHLNLGSQSASDLRSDWPTNWIAADVRRRLRRFGRRSPRPCQTARLAAEQVHSRADEIRALRELRRQFPDSGFVFATERGGPFTPDAVNRLIKRIGERAGFDFPVHCHMLRHACGYARANAGHDTRALQDWLGHRSIQHTVRYTELAPTRFKDFWRD